MFSFSLTAVKRGAVLISLAAASVLTPSLVRADTPIYAGQPKDQVGITLSGWGSGQAVESTEKRYSGERSIKIVTQGMYAGGCVEFKDPLELKVGDPKSDEYLQFLTCFNQMVTLNPAGYTYGQAYGGYDYGSSPSDLIQMPKVSKVRLIFVTESGKKIEFEEPVVSSEDDEGWPRINVPLGALKVAEDEKSIKVKKILFFTDIPDTFYIGEINLITDNTPITCDADSSDDQVVQANEVVLFRANADGGASTLLYSWDFDGKDGIQEDAGGPVVVHLYRKPGNYNITLTVRDANGLKAPATAKIKIEVND